MTPPKIIATSDLHGSLPPTPDCDVLIVAGDVCPDVPVGDQLDFLDGPFRAWLQEQPAKVILGIAGNHDFVFEKWPGPVAGLHLPWWYLKDNSCIWQSISFYGIPWVPNLSRWAFHADDYTLDDYYDAIPTGIDVVISHGPPWGHHDFTVPKFGSVHVGAVAANKMLQRAQPQAFVCGHIHEGYGTSEHPSGATIYNVSHNTENYDPVNPPMEIPVKEPTWKPGWEVRHPSSKYPNGLVQMDGKAIIDAITDGPGGTI